MAVAKMLKMRLVGICSEQDTLLNALHKTGAVEIKNVTGVGLDKKVVSDKSSIDQKTSKLTFALNYLTKKVVGLCDKQEKPDLQDGFDVGYQQFMSVIDREQELLSICESIEQNNEKIKVAESEIVLLNTQLSTYLPYEKVENKFTDFVNTKHTVCAFGELTVRNAQTLYDKLSGEQLAICNVHAKNEKSLIVSVVYHESVSKKVEDLLSQCAFIKCPFNSDCRAIDEINELKGQISQKQTFINQTLLDMKPLLDKVKDIKILADHYGYLREKLVYSDDFIRTDSTFILECFVPEEARERVSDAIKQASNNAYYEFENIADGEYAPTLLKNKKIAKQFEFVTGIYSSPKYNSLDPHLVMGIFFSMFMGFIMADMGYGIVMMAVGFYLDKKIKRDTGFRRLANVIAYGGIFALLFGFLFDSFFGYGLFRKLGLLQKTIFPDPVEDKSVVAGIQLSQVLLISLGMGVIQIMAGLMLKAVSEFRFGRFFDGFCDGIIWVIFFAGLLLFVIDMLGITNGLMQISLYIIIISLAFGAITAGRHAKGFGKFTSAFGAVYGLINYMSDILSYARLYGLMLSGAKIAEIVTSLVLPMMTNPIGFVLGAVILVIGHVFNLLMGGLGAFIHDSRLQYVEFFSRFYEGDGQLFKPFGTNFEHIYLCEKQNNN